jgi:FKBP-type peptidyl-prolyl cis-trans isomerase SlyD
MPRSQSIGPYKVVTLQYSLTNDDGVVVRDAGGKPIQYLHGNGALPPRLESRLATRKVGDIVRARLLPEDAFGKRDTNLLCKLPLADFPEGEKIEVGGHVLGTDEEGNEVMFAVTEITDGIVHLDGNHPLAGQTLIFEIEIQDIRDATAEEIGNGKASPG